MSPELSLALCWIGVGVFVFEAIAARYESRSFLVEAVTVIRDKSSRFRGIARVGIVLLKAIETIYDLMFWPLEIAGWTAYARLNAGSKYTDEPSKPL